MVEKKKVVKKSSKVNDAISHILDDLESIDYRLSELEVNSHESKDFDIDFDSIDVRLTKLEGRLGL